MGRSGTEDCKRCRADGRGAVANDRKGSGSVGRPAQKQSFVGRHASDTRRVTGEEGAAVIGGVKPRLTASGPSRHSTAEPARLQTV